MTITPSDVHTLGDYASDLLTVSIAALATTDSGAPVEAFVSAIAPPTFDCCPMLAVAVTGLAEAPTKPGSPAESVARRTTYGNIILAGYGIWALRCAPTVDGRQLPTMAQKVASADEVEQDGWALWNGIRHAVANGELFETCTGVHFDGGQPITEQGGCVGWVFRLRAMIPGIPNDGLS